MPQTNSSQYPTRTFLPNPTAFLRSTGPSPIRFSFNAEKLPETKKNHRVNAKRVKGDKTLARSTSQKKPHHCTNTTHRVTPQETKHRPMVASKSGGFKTWGGCTSGHSQRPPTDCKGRPLLVQRTVQIITTTRTTQDRTARNKTQAGRELEMQGLQKQLARWSKRSELRAIRFNIYLQHVLKCLSFDVAALTKRAGCYS